MRTVRRFRGALACAVLVAGCSVAPSTRAPMSVDAVLKSDATTPMFRVMQAEADEEAGGLDQVAVSDVQASSVRNDFFALSHVTDGNTHSAWAPSADDDSPTLTFELSETVDLSAMAIKMSPEGVSVNVEISTDGTTWETIATGLTPEVAALDWVDLDTTEARWVRLSFAGDAAATVLVCEVDFYAGEATVASPTPAPSATPTVTPSEGPSTTPSATPTPTPSETPDGECCVAVTGTSNVTIDGDAFNFEINTAAHSESGIGRVNFTDTRGTGSPRDDVHAQWTIVATRCIIEDGALTGAEVDADVDGDGTADITFTLLGDPPGNSGSHVKVNDLVVNVLTDVTLPFVDFDTTGPNADVQRSTQNVFPDDDCDGTPDPNTFPVG